ncbi:MAG: hypothetical protein ACTHKV_00900 [Flavipsychrobacter sp.]
MAVSIIHPKQLGTGTRDGTKFLRDDGTWQAPSGGVSDGDKGDVVVSSSGAVWTLEDQFKQRTELNMFAALGSDIKATPAYPVNSVSLSVAPIDQIVRLLAVYLPKAAVITGASWFQSTTGNYTANNYNGIGLYSYSGGILTLVASSTNDGNIWKGTGSSWQRKDFSSTYNAAPGIYYVAMLYCRSAATTAPTISMPPQSSFVLGLGMSNRFICGTYSSTATSLPSSINMSTQAAQNNSYYYFALY